MCAVASLQGECGLTGQLVNVKWSDSSSLWATMKAKGKKLRTEVFLLFPFPVFHLAAYFHGTFRNLIYFEIPITLSYQLEVGCTFRSYSQTQKPRKRCIYKQVHKFAYTRPYTNVIA